MLTEIFDGNAWFHFRLPTSVADAERSACAESGILIAAMASKWYFLHAIRKPSRRVFHVALDLNSGARDARCSLLARHILRAIANIPHFHGFANSKSCSCCIRRFLG